MTSIHLTPWESTDRDALAREMLEAWKIDRGLPNEKAADIALAHIAAARAEAFKEAAKIVWNVVPATCTNQWHVELIETCRALEALAKSAAQGDKT
jgi:hypothetical protein